MSTAAVKIEYTKLFINNEFVDAESKKTFPSVNPRTGEIITHVAEADEQDVNKAVKAARAAFRGEWGHLSSGARSLLLNKLADAVEKHKLELAAIDSLDNGKTFGMAVAFDIDNVIKTIRYFAGWADKITGKTMPFEGPFFAYTRHEPVGVVGAVIPWNFPLAMLGWKIAPALAAGNTIIIKTSEKTPLSALRFAAIVKEVGIPAGVVNILSGYGPTAGHALAAHPDVDLIAFTGSTATGRRIMHAAADSNLKKVCLELGGKSPVVVFEDVDLDEAVEGAHSALFFNAGQVCCAGSRTYVHEKVYDEFVKKSVERAKKIKLTHHDNEDPFAQGPQVDEIQHKSVLNWIEKGKASGAKLLTGGGIPKDTPGYYVEPTVFADVPDDAIIAKEEIFGPVQSIMKFKSVEEIIERANTSFYGLAASVWTKDITKAHALAAGIKAGTVWVNCHNVLDPAIPFGGFKQSGTGRDLSEYALQTYTQPKAVVIKL